MREVRRRLVLINQVMGTTAVKPYLQMIGQNLRDYPPDLGIGNQRLAAESVFPQPARAVAVVIGAPVFCGIPKIATLPSGSGLAGRAKLGGDFSSAEGPIIDVDFVNGAVEKPALCVATNQHVIEGCGIDDSGSATDDGIGLAVNVELDISRAGRGQAFEGAGQVVPLAVIDRRGADGAS